MLGQHERSDDLRAEGTQEGVAVQVGELAPGPDGGGGDDVGDDPETLAQRGDGALVGEVDPLGADARFVGVGGLQGLLIPARGDHSRARVPRCQADSAGDPAAPPDH